MGGPSKPYLNLTGIMDINQTPSLASNIVPREFRVPSRNIISVTLVERVEIGNNAL